jgi:hypothetical protein
LRLEDWTTGATTALHALHLQVPAAVKQLRALPGWTGWALAALGLWALLAGARFRRPLALVGGAFWGAAAALLSSAWLAGKMGMPLFASVAGAAVLLGGAGLLLPAVFPAAVGALVCAGLATLSGEPGAIVAGALLGLVAGVFLARFWAMVGAALMGAVVLAAALFLLVHGEPSHTLIRHPVVLLGALAVVAIAGGAFQLGAAWPGPRPRSWPASKAGGKSNAKTIAAE